MCEAVLLCVELIGAAGQPTGFHDDVVVVDRDDAQPLLVGLVHEVHGLFTAEPNADDDLTFGEVGDRERVGVKRGTGRFQRDSLLVAVTKTPVEVNSYIIIYLHNSQSAVHW